MHIFLPYQSSLPRHLRFSFIALAFQSFHPRGMWISLPAVVCMLYCYVVGTFGNFPPNITCIEDARDCIRLDDADRPNVIFLGQEHAQRGAQPLPYPRE